MICENSVEQSAVEKICEQCAFMPIYRPTSYQDYRPIEGFTPACC